MSIAWYEIHVPDLDVAQRFYGAVFGWSFQPFRDGYAVASEGGRPICGLSADQGSPAGRSVRVYLATDELESVLDRVRTAGGEVTQERTLVNEEFGWFALFTDPSGLSLGVMTSKPA